MRVWVIAVCLCGASVWTPAPAGTARPEVARVALRLPAAFVANVGQWESAARFVGRRGPVTVHAFDDALGVVLARPQGGVVDATAVRLQFEAPAQAVRPQGVDPLPTRFHYFLGRDPARWRTDVVGYRTLRYCGIRAGVDLVLREGEDGFAYDLHLAPGAPLSQVLVRVDGAVGPLRLDDEQALVVDTHLGPLRHSPPRAFVVTEHGPQPVGCSFQLVGQDRFAFVAHAPAGAALLIDPQLQYSTYLGGSAWDEVFAVAPTADGHAVVAGRTFSADFPTQHAWQARLAGAADAFLARLPLDGGPIVYATFLGGGLDDEARALALDREGGAVLGGSTSSTDFPTRQPVQAYHAGRADAFVAHVAADGRALRYATYLGGSGVDAIVGLTLDASARAVVVGGTSSTDFPTRNAFQAHAGGYDAFVGVLPLSGAPLALATYLGGSSDDGAVAVALDGSAAVVTGWTGSADFPTANAFQARLGGRTDAFVTRLPLDGAPPTLSTYLGGNDDDLAYALALDGGGEAVVAGGTSSADFPTSGAFQPGLSGLSDAFLTRLPLSGAPPSASTYLGGAATETALALALDPLGGAVLSGWTFSPDFPTANPWQQGHAGVADAFLVRITAGGPPTYATFLGGRGLDKPYAVAVDGSRTAVLVGLTDSPDFPLHNALQPTPAGYFDVFATRLDLLPRGTATFGSPTPGCAGLPAIDAAASPRVGSVQFAVDCERAPPSAPGLCALSSAGLANPLVVLGARVWVDPLAPALALLPIASTASGTARVPVPIPPHPELAGAKVFAQFLWADACAGGGVAASDGLRVTVQP
jgi:hypothetical protein